MGSQDVEVIWFCFEQMEKVDGYWYREAGWILCYSDCKCLFSAFRNISQVFFAGQGSVAGEPEQVFLFIASIPHTSV